MIIISKQNPHLEMEFVRHFSLKDMNLEGF